MASFIRDTAFGQLVRLVTRNKYLQYAEERDPSLWKQFVDEKKSGYMAHHGTLMPHEDGDTESMIAAHGVRTRDDMERQQTRGSTQGDGNTASLTSTRSEKSQLSRKDTNRFQREISNIKINKASGVKVDPEKGRDVDIVDWWGEGDPENPRNWSTGKKFFVTFQICLLTFGIYIGSAIYTAGLEGVVETFGVSSVAAELGLTLFVLGYGWGPMLWSPMSEIPFIGRNPVYISTALIFVIFQVPTALATNFGMLLAFRFLSGFFGSPVLATGGATLVDMYSPRKQAYAISVWGLAAICGPTMGPLVGGFAAEAEGWTWTIWELMWLSGFATVFLFFFLPETSANNILYRRTRRLRKVTGNDSLKCPPEIYGESMTGKDIVMMTLVRPITLNFHEPMVFLLNLYIALIYGLLYVWFDSFPVVFVEIYHFNLGTLGLSFLGIFVGGMLVIPFYFAYLYYIQEPQFDENGSIQPEKRLPVAFVGGPAVVICMFWFGWSAGNTHWIMPIIGSGFFTVGAFLLFNAVLNYLPDAYPDYAASVLAGNDMMRSTVGAAFPLFGTGMYHNLGVGWASSLLGFLALAFVPIPYVLYHYGKTLRVNHSKFARKDI